MEHKFKLGDVVLYIGFRTIFHDIPFVVLDSCLVCWKPRPDEPNMEPEYKIHCQVLFGDIKRNFFQEDLQIYKLDE